jgi:hypothetical protein
MIIAHLSGGLGNQMFQYALGRHLAEKNSTLLKLDLSGFEIYKLHRYGLHCFKIWEYVATIEEIEAFKRKNPPCAKRWVSKIGKRLSILTSATSDFYQSRSVIKENRFNFEPSVLEAKGNIYLEGYWQSGRYFSEIRDFLLREFAFKYEQDVKSLEIAEQIQETESVSLHIRRGDYVHDPLTNHVHGLCSINYYKNAVNYITQKIPNCHFFLFSDDHPWVCENFNLDYPVTIVDCNNASTNYEDLRLMSLCHHNIIANSSFSWWGAWLNTNPEKIVLAPEKWFNDSILDTKDLLPESWVKIRG